MKGAPQQVQTFTALATQPANATAAGEATCPSSGATKNVTCDIPSDLCTPRNCTARWELERDSCNTTCGPALCWRTRILNGSADPEGLCDEQIGSREAYETYLGPCCSAQPAPWAVVRNGLLQSPLVQSWSCKPRVDGLVPTPSTCTGTCMDGTLGKVSTSCEDGAYNIYNSCKPSGNSSAFGVANVHAVAAVPATVKIVSRWSSTPACFACRMWLGL